MDTPLIDNRDKIPCNFRLRRRTIEALDRQVIAANTPHRWGRGQTRTSIIETLVQSADKLLSERQQPKSAGSATARKTRRP